MRLMSVPQEKSEEERRKEAETEKEKQVFNLSETQFHSHSFTLHSTPYDCHCISMCDIMCRSNVR